MNCTVIIDWKFALGAVAVATIFAVKMDAADAKDVSIHVVDACKKHVMVDTGDC